MSLQNHLVELEKRHQAVERELEAERHSPSSSDLRIAELKRRKLHIKDEILKLQNATSSGSLH